MRNLGAFNSLFTKSSFEKGMVWLFLFLLLLLKISLRNTIDFGLLVNHRLLLFSLYLIWSNILAEKPDAFGIYSLSDVEQLLALWGSPRLQRQRGGLQRCLQKCQRVADTKTPSSAKSESFFEVSSLVKCSDVCLAVIGDTALVFVGGCSCAAWIVLSM